MPRLQLHPGARQLPLELTASPLFDGWDADSFKLYVWLRTRVEPGPAVDPDARHGYLEAHATSAQIESAVGVSKNTVTKLVRALQERAVATFRSDRDGYHLHLGEWFARRAEGGIGDLDLVGYTFYLDATLDSSR